MSLINNKKVHIQLIYALPAFILIEKNREILGPQQKHLIALNKFKK